MRYICLILFYMQASFYEIYQITNVSFVQRIRIQMLENIIIVVILLLKEVEDLGWITRSIIGAFLVQISGRPAAALVATPAHGAVIWIIVFVRKRFERAKVLGFNHVINSGLIWQIIRKLVGVW